jgi:septum site-determining protein MinD
MAGRVIVVTSGKGGVGKTTTVANIGTGLALRHKKVVMIDADIGLRNLDVVMGLENRIVYDLVDVAEKNCRSTSKALIKDKRLGNLFLLPAAQTRNKDALSPEQMIAIVDELKEDFDYILIDCPAGIERGFNNAVAAASEAIVVTTPEVSAVRDADRIIGLLQEKEIYEPVLVLNRLRPEMVRKGDMMDVDDINDILAIKLLGIVPDDEEIIISTNRGEPAVLNDHSKAGEAFRNVVRRMEGEEVPFMSVDGEPGLFGRFLKILQGK